MYRYIFYKKRILFYFILSKDNNRIFEILKHMAKWFSFHHAFIPLHIFHALFAVARSAPCLISREKDQKDKQCADDNDEGTAQILPDPSQHTFEERWRGYHDQRLGNGNKQQFFCDGCSVMEPELECVRAWRQIRLRLEENDLFIEGPAGQGKGKTSRGNFPSCRWQQRNDNVLGKDAGIEYREGYGPLLPGKQRGGLEFC